MRLWEFLFVRNYIYSILLIFLVHFFCFCFWMQISLMRPMSSILAPVAWALSDGQLSVTLSLFLICLSLWIWGTLSFLHLITWEFILEQKSNFWLYENTQVFPVPIVLRFFCNATTEMMHLPKSIGFLFPEFLKTVFRN